MARRSELEGSGNSAKRTEAVAEATTPPEYWQAVYRRSGRLRRRCLGKWSFPQIGELAEHLAPLRERQATEFLEVGCAPGGFMVYFHQVHGWTVSGIELSEAGLTRTRELLAVNGVEARLYQGDVLQLRPDRQYDVVGSFGLVEHFDDPLPCYRAMSQWLRPGGALLVTVPNLLGPIGRAMRFRNYEQYLEHKQYGPCDLEAHCRAVGLAPAFSGLVGNVYVPPVVDGVTATRLGRLLNLPGRVANQMLASLAGAVRHPIKLGSLTGYVGCVAWKNA